MGFGDVPPPPKSHQLPPETKSEDALIHSIFLPRERNDQQETVENLGRIGMVALPQGWVKGRETSSDNGYARQYHPQEPNAIGEFVDKGSVQLLFSYRGHRLSDGASNAFRELIDSAPGDGRSRVLPTGKLQEAPLNEVLGDLGHKNTFRIISARIEKMNGEPALVVEGKYANYDVNTKLIYIDGERNARQNGNAPVQEIAVMAPTKEFYKYAMKASASLSDIEWKD